MIWYGIFLIILGILLLFLIIKLIANRPSSPVISNLREKIIILTGASAGIGKETAIGLLNQGAKVICASRSEDKTNEVINKSKFKQNGFYYKLDLSSFKSIIDFSNKIKNDFPEGIDILINNAGQIFTLLSLTEDNIERTIQTNHIGPFILTGMLIDHIKPNGKLINVSSTAHQFAKIDLLETLENDIDLLKLNNYYNFMNFYSFTKLANVEHIRFIAKNYPNLTTASLHPGFVDSDIWKNSSGCFKILTYCLKPLMWFFMKSEKMGAQTTLYLVHEDNEKIKNAGYYDDCKEKLASGLANVNGINERIMKYTKKLIEKYFNDMPIEIRKHLDLISIMAYETEKV